jgi:DNA anti-recombination protein RmuC
MELMQANSTDKRLDDLNHKVDQGFERIDADIGAHRVETRAEFSAVRAELKAGFDSMNKRFDAMTESSNKRFDAMTESSSERFDAMNESSNLRFDAMNERFERMHRLLIQVGGGLIGTMVVASAGLIATQL